MQHPLVFTALFAVFVIALPTASLARNVLQAANATKPPAGTTYPAEYSKWSCICTWYDCLARWL